MSVTTTRRADGTPICTTATGAGLEAFRWLSIRGRIKLESLGMRHSGGPTRPRIAAELGLKPRSPYSAFLVAIEKKLETLHPQIAAENAAEKEQQP